MDVPLTPELESLIEAEVRSGRSQDPKDFFDKAVFHYVIARDLGEEYSRDEMDALIAEGLDDIERGDTVDGAEALRLLKSGSSMANATCTKF